MARDTRDKILDAATRLFAASDSRGASLRAIAREAGVNSALIHYHFGSREGLFEAVVLRALVPVQARRLTLMAAMKAQGPPSAAGLARLFVEPLLPTEGDDHELQAVALRLLARSFTEQRSLVEDLTLKHFGDLMYTLGDLLSKALPDLSFDVKCQRMRFCVQAALETLSGSEMEVASQHGDAARERLGIDLIDFLAGGLEAPMSTRPRT